mmetsp:Transcript_33533/g.56240  ORF Transcript_33533/g.56240 Transcript_33533/m.56240 type:complete len:238 (-) Transcript_33533:776-1489(-)
MHICNVLVKEEKDSLEETFKVENMLLMMGFVRSPSEDHFMTAFTEMNYAGKELVNLIIKAQEACLAGDDNLLIKSLVQIGDCEGAMIDGFMRLSTNLHSSAYIDQQDLTRRTTVNFVPPPEDSGSYHDASGTAGEGYHMDGPFSRWQVRSTISGLFAPFFTALDLLAGRRVYTGQNSRMFQENGPFISRLEKDFMAALVQPEVNMPDYVARSKSSKVKEAYLYLQAMNDRWLVTHMD